MSVAFLLTGTDTAIGKTTVGCAIAAALGLRGLKVGVCKPFETGCEPQADGSVLPADTQRLRYFADCREPLELICPIRCREPLAPAVALRREGREIDLERLGAAVRALADRHDVTLVEGAGGLLVPVSERTTFADLARQWRLPVLVVVGNRLGALNHAQLTLRAAAQAGLDLLGYVVNQLAPAEDVAMQTNVAALEGLVGPPLGVLPWVGAIECTPADRQRLARVAEANLRLDRLLEAE
jgi:dethiobiotin synthetase